MEVERMTGDDLQQNLQQLLRDADAGAEGLLLKGYTFERKLGEGGMGAVFLLRETAGQGQVAIKLMRPHLAPDENARKLFRREIANVMALRHDNIVGFRGYSWSDNLLFLIMDFCDRGSVAARMRQAGGKLPLPEALDLTFQTLNGLAYAHQARIPNVELADGSLAEGVGLVHRDLKPDNLFLTSAGERKLVKIGDFGLAKAFQLAGLSGHTLTGHARGTPQFMPRQQVLDFKYSGPEVDIWALTACLYNMLTGSFPRRFSTGDPWYTVLHTKPVSIRKHDSTIPAALAAVVDSALDDSGDELRFSSAADLQHALRTASPGSGAG